MRVVHHRTEKFESGRFDVGIFYTLFREFASAMMDVL